MLSAGIKKEYICIDTFSDFTHNDIDFEKQHRSKDKNVLKVQFVANKRDWVAKTLKYNNIEDVKLNESDINHFAFKENGINKIAFCLIDVDLYIPVKSALNKVWDLVESGGIIIVDDCRQDRYYDGALQAYQEFVREKNYPEVIVLDKLGVIEKK